MKRIFCALLMVAMLLGGIGNAEETVSTGAAACQHEYVLCNEFLPEHDWIREKDAEGAFKSSTRCTRCGDACIIIEDLSLLEPDPCDPEECTHRLYMLAGFSRTEWQPMTEKHVSLHHQRAEYDVGACLDCGTVATVFALMETGYHQMEEKTGFHVNGQYIHVTCQECRVCGLMTGALVPCVSYEDGTCDRVPAR